MSQQVANGVKLPQPLCPTNKNSFAYKTVKDRLPVTITRAIDYIYRFRNELIERFTEGDNKEVVTEDTKSAIERLSQLRYELTTDKPLKVITDEGEDAHLWNKALEELESRISKENATWFKAPWLFTECYMYRRIREAMLLCESKLKFYDVYEESKKDAYRSTEQTIISLIKGLCPLDRNEIDTELLKEIFETTLQVSLWSNKNDLSLSSGDDSISSKVHNLLHSLEDHMKNLIKNETNQIWSFVVELNNKYKETGQTRRFDIILDNTGMEFISDLILADFVLTYNLFDVIYLHAKAYSWFVSDVTLDDFNFVIRNLQRCNSIYIDRFLKRVKSYQEEKKLIFVVSSYWTLPYSYHEMRRVDNDLYMSLSKSDLILFKGDLNYRKLLGDLDWPHDKPLRIVIQDFFPTSIALLRTLKCDLVADLNETNSIVKQVSEKDKNWMISGDYGIIQFIKKD